MSAVGWVAIPHSAFAAVRGPLARGAIADLYHRAHLVGYVAMPVTDRGLAKDWEMSRHEVWLVLESLAAAGCIDLEKGSPGVPTQIRVLPVVGDREPSGGGSGQGSSQKPAKKERPKTPIIEASGPASRPASGPTRASSDHARVEETRPDQKQVDDGETRAREPIDSQVEQLEALQADQEGVKPDSSDRAAVRRALTAGWTPEQLAALWAWSGVSDDRLVDGCRDGGWRRWRSLLGGRFPDARLKAAIAWDAAGRPIATAAPSSSRRPSTAAPPRKGVRALLAEAKAMRAAQQQAEVSP